MSSDLSDDGTIVSAGYRRRAWAQRMRTAAVMRSTPVSGPLDEVSEHCPFHSMHVVARRHGSLSSRDTHSVRYPPIRLEFRSTHAHVQLMCPGRHAHGLIRCTRLLVFCRKSRKRCRTVNDVGHFMSSERVIDHGVP